MLSRMCSIEVRLYHRLAQPTRVFLHLLASGWRLSYRPGDLFLYIPFGTDDDDLAAAPADAFAAVLAEMDRKVAAQQRLGVEMLFDETGALVYALPPYDRIGMYINNPGRKRVSEDSPVTDYSWYLRRLIPALVDHEREVAEVICNDMT